VKLAFGEISEPQRRTLLEQTAVCEERRPLAREANEVNKIADEFKDNDIEQPTGKRGILIVTGTTSSARGNAVSSAFALVSLAHELCHRA